MDKVRALKVGGVDFVTKPYQKDEVLIRLGTHLKIRTQQKQLDKYSQHLEDLVQMQVQEMNKSQTATIAALAKLAESRDDDTGRHIERITLYCQALATKLAASSPYAAEITPEFIEALYYASPLHDIGKIAIADSVLLKPDKLSPEEFEVMKKHTTIGARNLASIHAKYPKNVFVRAGLCIARSHHERWDGTGYPDGAKAEEIPLYARIMAVADVYEAMRSNKCYHKALSHEEACEMIKKGAGTQFDPQIVTAFEQIANEFLRITNESADSLT
jgi:putative two-component system response regulator